VNPIVSTRNNPLLTIVNPLPIPGTEYGLNFAAQIADLRVDFHPGNKIDLPSEIGIFPIMPLSPNLMPSFRLDFTLVA
jgi:hypothetical protein